MNKKFLSLVLSLVMVLGTFTSVFAASETVKKDEKATEKVEKVEKITGKDNKIQYIIDKKFVEGYGDGEFGYDKNIKRSEITKLLVFANGHKDLSEKLQGTMKLYKDVDTAYWANGVIAVGTTVPSTSNNQAMLNGYPDGNFLPENNVTYAELSKMLVVLVKEDLTADDVKKANANWAGQWMSWAAQLGILDDVTVADSNAAATRADAFTMLYNALYKMQNFKREATDDKVGILSDLSNKKLVLNQDKEEEYTITDDTVFVRNSRDLDKDGNDNLVKVQSVRNPEYYLGSLVRIMVNDKKEVTHILELGNPKDGALSNKSSENKENSETKIKFVEDNKRWSGVADATITTEMSDITSIKNLTDSSKEIEDLKSWAKLVYKNSTDVDKIEIRNSENNNVETIDVDDDDVKVYIANPANNQMKEAKDIYAALRLIGYDKDLTKIPNVYVGYDDNNRSTATNKYNNKDAQVIVFNVVAKDNDMSETYRVSESTSSKGAITLEDVDGKKYDKDDFKNGNRFPFDSAEKFDVVEYKYTTSDNSYDWEYVIEHKANNKNKFPIVLVTDYDEEDDFITVEDKEGNEAVLDIRDADIFTAKDKIKADKTYVQFVVEDKKDSKNVVDTLSILGEDMDFRGVLSEENVNGINPSDNILGKLKEVVVIENTDKSSIRVKRYNNLTEEGNTSAKTYKVINFKEAERLKKYVLDSKNENLLIRFNINEDNEASDFIVVDVEYNKEFELAEEVKEYEGSLALNEVGVPAVELQLAEGDNIKNFTELRIDLYAGEKLVGTVKGTEELFGLDANVVSTELEFREGETYWNLPATYDGVNKAVATFVMNGKTYTLESKVIDPAYEEVK